MNWRENANHPTLGLDAKSGGEALAASADRLKLAAKQSAPAKMPAVKLPACLDIGSSSSTQ
jgi:hypothetical protein